MKVLIIATLIGVCAAQTPIWFDGVCGRSKYPDAGSMPLPPRGKFIVGGIEAKEHEFPWQVSLRTPSNSHFCGGSLINDWWVITASHCVDGDTPSSLIIVAGDHTRNAPNPVRQTLAVSKIVMHPNYDNYWLYNDVALVKLASPVVLSADVAPVCAPDSGNLYVYDKCEVSGWGTLSSGGACCPQTLMYVTMNVTDNLSCAAAYDPEPVTADMVCATDNTGSTERDSCQGDSGGPLTVQSADGSFALVGLVSWGYGCASGHPGVYCRVSEFNDWITQTLADN